ncbi:MAG: ATP-dependent zinc metalloprotease FtsH, partial [Nitrospinota bacterium]
MNQPPQKPARPGDKPRKRPFGPFLVLTTALLLLLVIFGSPPSRRTISVDAFRYNLYTGGIETAAPQDQSSRITGSFRKGVVPAGQESFTVTWPRNPEIDEWIRNQLAKKPEGLFGADEILRDVEKGGKRPVRIYTLKARRPSGDEAAAGPAATEQRLFLDYTDRQGLHYAEVLLAGADIGQLLEGLESANEAAEVTDEFFDLDKGMVVEEGNSALMYFLGTFGPILLFLALFWFIFMRQMRGQGQGLMSFGRSRAVLYNKENRTKVSFEDVAGIDDAKDEVGEIIEFLKNPTRFQRLGGRIPRGVLLVGPPGTGKTLLAKAIAGEADVPFLSISGSDFVEMFVGVGASRVRDLFKQAKDSAPCILFLDEIDAVGRKRGSGMGGGHDEREQTLNAILVEMDGFDTDEGIIVIAATNRPDVLDPALLRPGRFDREIVIDLPDINGRDQILQVHSREVKLAPGVDMAEIARGTPGFSGAELSALVNEAAILAVMKNHLAVTQDDLEEARDKIRFGRQKKSRAMDLEDKTITAYHEAGHTVVSQTLEHAEPVHKVTIIPRGMSLGATMQLPEKEHLHLTRKKLLDELTVLYGGRVAEEMFCDDITSGASN